MVRSASLELQLCLVSGAPQLADAEANPRARDADTDMPTGQHCVGGRERYLVILDRVDRLTPPFSCRFVAADSNSSSTAPRPEAGAPNEASDKNCQSRQGSLQPMERADCNRARISGAVVPSVALPGHVNNAVAVL